MFTHKGKRIFITGIPTSGKSYLAKQVADKVGGIAVLFDDFRENLAKNDQYRKWTNFYLDVDEKEYLTKTNHKKQWENLVAQSEGLWPAFLQEIEKYKNETKPVIFECVNILPHIAKRDLDFNGVVLIGKSYEEILERNKQSPRWGNTIELQELEAKAFFEVERPYYKAEAEKYGYPVFESADEAFSKIILEMKKDEKNMLAKTVLDLYFSLEKLGINIWVDGGWSVDASLEKQTRSHTDLDIAIQYKDVPKFREYMSSLGYSELDRDEDKKWNFVLGDNFGHEVDVHAFNFDESGHVVEGIEYPDGSLTGVGKIENQIVRCIDPKHMVDFHTRYEPKEKDFQDVKALCDKFSIPYPNMFKK